MVLGIKKETGMTSHDVVSRIRQIFGEKRVGHAGTLDPLAEGVLPILVGPATRLNTYLVEHDKRYTVDIVFGVSTETDDAQGAVVSEIPVPSALCDPAFAQAACKELVGKGRQVPPRFSAIKVKGKKACDEARKGKIIKLEPRAIEVYEASLIGLGNAEAHTNEALYQGRLYWTVSFYVSKGTYIRALARDLGKKLRTGAYVGALRRESVGAIDLEDCLTLDEVKTKGVAAAIDPLRLLGMRFIFLTGEERTLVKNGRVLDARDLEVFEHCASDARYDCCSSPVVRSGRTLEEGEALALVFERSIEAIYRFEKASGLLRPDCVFQRGVSRGIGA